MRASMQNYAAVIELRHNVMEAIFAKISLKITKSAIRNISVSTDFGGTNDHAFTSIKEQLAPVKLSYSKSEFEMRLFSDASRTHWSAIISQVHESQRNEKSTSNNANLYVSFRAHLRAQAKAGTFPRKKDSQSRNLCDLPIT